MKRISEEDLKHVLENTKGIIGALKNKSVFITGATGFFGKWLLESFLYLNKVLSLNASVCALSRDPDAFLAQFPFYKNEPGITFLKGDIQNFIFPKGRFHYIIHAATEADAKLNSENPLLMLNTIINGTKRVLDFANLHAVEGFLLTSSGAVYGKQPNNITHITESAGFHIDINNIASAYAEGKRVAELYCAIYYKQYNIPVKIARCFAFIGPHLPLTKHFAIGNFILNGLNNEDIIIKGDGTPYRSYMYAADLVIWLWTILLKGQVNTPYNVGSDVDLTIAETAELVASCFKNKVNVKVLTQKNADMPIERYVPNIDYAANLNLHLAIGIDDAIKKTCTYYL